MVDINTETPNGVLTAFLEVVDEFEHVVIVGLKKGEAGLIIVGHDQQHAHEVIGLLHMGIVTKEDMVRNPEDYDES